MTISCKRVYDRVEKDDGYRVLVDRMWPRGLKKTDLAYDEWCRDVAPSSDLRTAFHSSSLNFDEFGKAYRRELGTNQPAWTPLLYRAGHGNVTLLYASRDRERNHARVLAAFLIEHYKKEND
jgi:uncharacterized protein YeaO (DUF488 family)